MYDVSDWLMRLDERSKGIPYTKMSHFSSKHRIPISSKLRENVWYKTNQEYTGYCYVCEGDICKDKFECGHVIPIIQGGTTIIDNLFAICKDCNLRMGSQNLNDFKDEIIK